MEELELKPTSDLKLLAPKPVNTTPPRPMQWVSYNSENI